MKLTTTGHAITILAIGVAISYTMTTEAYGDHINRNIWVETAEGNFITATETALNKINEVYNKCDNCYDKTHAITNLIITIYNTEKESEFNENYKKHWDQPGLGRLNNIKTIDQRECGDMTSEVEHLSNELNTNKFMYTTINPYSGPFGYDIYTITDANKHLIDEKYVTTAVKTEQNEQQKYHENICGYWYNNVVKSEYTYTILDLPNDRETPPDYNNLVKAGVEAGLNSWGDINDIEFRYTDNKLEANIIIQQQIGDGTAYGNAELGCLFDHKQCTIQLFTDINVNKRQTLANKQSIEWTTGHEFGHLIGLPHHIEPDNIMNTIQDNNIRTYYEARNINVPDMKEPTYEQRLLGYESSETYTTDDASISEITKNKKFTEFVEYIAQVIRNTPKDDRLGLWWDITDEIYDRIRSIIHN